MGEFISQYGLFFAKTVTVVAALLALFAGAGILLRSRAGRDRLEVRKLNDKYARMALTLQAGMLAKQAFKRAAKTHKREQQQRETAAPRPRVFVLKFDGDIRASSLASLREEITAILTVAAPADEVFVRLHSGGGLVHAYGLAAAQLLRIKNRGIPLTIAVDRIAASGGYMMACVADRILAAPFAIIGSIGVVAQVPNFYRWLRKNDIDYEEFTAGEFKRTVTLFGENTEKARSKFKQEIEETHTLFKEFIAAQRPRVDLARTATGEYWHGRRALDLGLIDALNTSDDYLLDRSREADLYEVHYLARPKVGVKMPWFVREALEGLLSKNAKTEDGEG